MRSFNPHFRSALLASSLLGVLLGSGGAAAADPVLDILTAADKPAFRPGHTLLPLSTWGPELSFEVRKELADHWGYCLQFGRLRPDLAAKLDDPQSVVSKVCALARSDPKKYPLHVITAPAFTIRTFKDELPAGTWCRDAEGELIDGKKTYSPEAPDATFEMIARHEAEMIRKVLEKAPIAVLTNGGEYGLSTVGHHLKDWQRDPKVLKAKGRTSWFEYISKRKAHQEKIITDAMRKLVPARRLYIYYHTSSSPHRNRYGGWWRWAWDYQYMRPISDMPNSSIYWKHYNSGFTGGNDMLTQALNATARNLTFGQKYSYNWLCAGWRGKGRPADADPRRYEGYLKCYYTAGQIGGVAGYFAYDDPTNWIWQHMTLGRVHALFSHLEPFVRNSELLGGPNKHVWSKELAAYEFPTGDQTARVLVRKHKDGARWLITAWAADGDARDVTVEIPALGRVTVKALPNAAVYFAQKRGAKPVVKSAAPPHR